MIEIGSIWIDKQELYSTFNEGPDSETCLLIVGRHPFVCDAVTVISNLGIVQDSVLIDSS